MNFWRPHPRKAEKCGIKIYRGYGSVSTSSSRLHTGAIPIRNALEADAVQAEVHTAETRNQELRTRLLDARNRRDPDRTALLEQVHNLQNLLLVLKAPGEGVGAFARSDDGLGGDSLFGALDLPPLDNAMSRGAEMLCHQKTRDAELIEVRPDFCYCGLVLGRFYDLWVALSQN